MSLSTSCKLCHGPLTSAVPVPMSPAMQSTASRQAQPIPAQIDCHQHCVAFACPGCIAEDRPSYAILNFQNHIYDYHCGQCMSDLPPITVASQAMQASVSTPVVC